MEMVLLVVMVAGTLSYIDKQRQSTRHLQAIRVRERQPRRNPVKE